MFVPNDEDGVKELIPKYKKSFEEMSELACGRVICEE